MPMKSTKKTPSAREMAGKNRHYAQNRKKPAPLGRYEDMSPLRANRATKKAVKKAASEGPKRSMPKKKK